MGFLDKLISTEVLDEVKKVFEYIGMQTHKNRLMLERICEKMDINVDDIKVIGVPSEEVKDD